MDSINSSEHPFLNGAGKPESLRGERARSNAIASWQHSRDCYGLQPWNFAADGTAPGPLRFRPSIDTWRAHANSIITAGIKLAGLCMVGVLVITIPPEACTVGESTDTPTTSRPRQRPATKVKCTHVLQRVDKVIEIAGVRAGIQLASHSQTSKRRDYSMYKDTISTRSNTPFTDDEAFHASCMAESKISSFINMRYTLFRRQL